VGLVKEVAVAVAAGIYFLAGLVLWFWLSYYVAGRWGSGWGVATFMLLLGVPQYLRVAGRGASHHWRTGS